MIKKPIFWLVNLLASLVVMSALAAEKPEFFGVFLVNQSEKMIGIDPVKKSYYTQIKPAGPVSRSQMYNLPSYRYVNERPSISISPTDLKAIIVYQENIDIDKVKLCTFATIKSFLAGKGSLFENKGNANNDSVDYWIDTNYCWIRDNFKVKKLDENMYYLVFDGATDELENASYRLFKSRKDVARQNADFLGIKIGKRYYLFSWTS